VQALALAAGSGAAQVLVAVLYILTARSMQPDEYGLVVTAIALGLAGAGFVDLGASSYWIREVASGRGTQELLNSKMGTRILIASTVAALLIVVAAMTDPHFIATGVLLLSTTTVITMLVPLRAARRATMVGWLTVLGRTVAIIAFFGLLAFGVEPGRALWISMAIGDLCLVVYIVLFERSQLWPTFHKRSNPWAGAKWYSLSTLSGSAQLLDLPIVGLCGGASAAGIYGGVNRWIQPMVLTVSAFASAAAPFLAAVGDPRTLRRQILRASWILAAAIVLSIGVIFAAPWLVVVLLGDAFASSAPVLQWLAGAMILNTIAQPLIVALQSRRFDHLAAIILLGSVGVQLVVVAALAPTLGPLSAGIAFFTSQVLQLLGSATCIAVIVRRRKGTDRGSDNATQRCFTRRQ
jgi:O-antigen/teichoic acid export membrane protein